MKIVVFAHTPPPHHGQSYMVQLMLQGFGGDQSHSPSPTAKKFGVECYHVNVRLSDDLQDIGSMRGSKVKRLFAACRQAIQLRRQFSIDTLYYIPAPAKKSAIIRDWIVLGILRRFFKRIVLHWHAFGLGYWATSLIEQPGGAGYRNVPPPVLFGQFEPLARAITRAVYRHCDLSIALTDYNLTDVRALSPKKAVVVPNGIPDQCANLFPSLLLQRQQRLASRHNDSSSSPIFRVLFLAHCTREKGLFVAMDAIEIANKTLETQKATFRLEMIVAGTFPNPTEQKEFQDRTAGQSLENGSPFRYVGLIDATTKATLLSECDALVFPVFYQPETFGLVLAEALSFGLPSVATSWRGIPDILGTDPAQLAAPEDPLMFADRLLEATSVDDFASLRERFVEHYDLPRFLSALAREFSEIDRRPA
jgi:glycosyltransferase involved in cell wall biosynthesis